MWDICTFLVEVNLTVPTLVFPPVVRKEAFKSKLDIDSIYNIALKFTCIALLQNTKWIYRPHWIFCAGHSATSVIKQVVLWSQNKQMNKNTHKISKWSSINYSPLSLRRQ